MGENLYASDLIDDLGTPPWLANRVARLYTYEQLAKASLDDLMSVFGKECLGELKKITAHARIKTEGNKPTVARAELPQDSLAALYALIGKAVVAWSVAKLNGVPHVVHVASTRVWVRLAELDLQMSWKRPYDSTTGILVSDPASLYKFLGLAEDRCWNLSATAVLQALIDYAEAYDRID